MAYAKIRPRRGTPTQWTTANTLLNEGELGIEVPEEGVGRGHCKIKIGDGVTNWNELPYALDVIEFLPETMTLDELKTYITTNKKGNFCVAISESSNTSGAMAIVSPYVDATGGWCSVLVIYYNTLYLYSYSASGWSKIQFATTSVTDNLNTRLNTAQNNIEILQNKIQAIETADFTWPSISSGSVSFLTMTIPLPDGFTADNTAIISVTEHNLETNYTTIVSPTDSTITTWIGEYYAYVKITPTTTHDIVNSKISLVIMRTDL